MPARRHATRLMTVLALLLLGGCATTMPRPQPGTAYAERANDVLFSAIGLVGTPYRYGGNTPRSGFDCSGLVDYVFRTAAGVDLPRTTRQMGALDAPRVALGHLAPGDLVFFNTEGGGVSHVGIYVGKGRFVHAPDTGGTVRLDPLDNPYWARHFLYGKRVLQ